MSSIPLQTMTRSQRTTITNLPNELIDSIFSFISRPADVSALTFCSRRFWLLADPHLFTSVVIESLVETFAFREALEKRPQRAAVVRRLLVCADPDDTNSEDGNDDISYPTSNWCHNNSEICVLPLLHNLTTYRVEANMPPTPHHFQAILISALHGDCLLSLRKCMCVREGVLYIL